MKFSFATFVFILLSGFSMAQKVKSGDYGSGLKLALHPTTQKITGYFEGYSGWEEETKGYKFSCVFYLEGFLTGEKIELSSYYPGEQLKESIAGTIEIVDEKQIKVSLKEEHGGCWNVQHFADEALVLDLENEKEWLQIAYVNAEKAYFYSDKNVSKKRKQYIVKGNFFCIEKIEKESVYGSYFGEKEFKGWLQKKDLNDL